jgi:hypothetical protein
MVALNFSSVLKAARRAELEKLMFFHPHQEEWHAKINDSVIHYGFPKIVETDGLLKIGIEGVEVQTLYGFVDCCQDQELAGVLVYSRIELETLALIHMAVKPEFCYSSGYKNELILVRLLAQLRRVAKRINGVRQLSIVYFDKMIPKAPIRQAQ